MSDIAIKVEGLSKRYVIGHQKATSIADKVRYGYQRLFGQKGNYETEEFWALKDISFEIKRGEAVGIIGKNGAGKSTLLKILSRITYPTSGRFEMNGRVSSLLEVGTGFHPELSGRENIYLNGTILGMTRPEIRSKFDEIVDFSGVEKFIDTPVKHYSSGMYVRLAFAVAAHLEPEILIIDEVLAVGDAEFQKKCLGKMDEVAKAGRTVLFVSHNLKAIKALCPKSIFIKKGQMVLFGKSNQIVDMYTSVGMHNYTNDIKLNNKILKRLTVSEKLNAIEVGSDLHFRLEYYNEEKIQTPQFCFIIKKADGLVVSSLISNYSINGINIRELKPGNGTILLEIKNMCLLPGEYIIDLKLWQPGRLLDQALSVVNMKIIHSQEINYRINETLGIILLQDKWYHE